MRPINLIAIHCSATPASMDIGVKEIRVWHVKDNGWKDIGYHFVIRRNGTVEVGRPLEQPGSHIKGYNASSIGISMVGGAEKKNGVLVAANNFTPAQFKSLEDLVKKLAKQYPNAQIKGHRDVQKGKECPSFSVRDWWTKVSGKAPAWV